ncbi:MAG TPA: proprotein convertase P-domain-containing protein [Pyrinomonadaceae bacterium]|jgi:subtilisin-like proprotein convertase family protein
MKSRLHLATAALLLLTFAADAFGQVLGNQTSGVPTTARYTQAVLAPAGSQSNVVEFPADPRPGGGDVVQVTSSTAEAAVSLVLPNGVEVTPANAASLGFEYGVLADGAFTGNGDALSVFSAPGTNTFISFPPASPAGTYRVKIDASAATAETAALVTYYSSSLVRAGVATNSSVYRVGEKVVISGLVFDGPTPVRNATVLASVDDVDRPDADPVQLTLTDSGPLDVTPGDGIYTGSFTPDHAGDFAVAIKATGASAANLAFARTSSTDFNVTPTTARFVSFRNEALDADGDGLVDEVLVTAGLDVQAAGQYQFALTLVAGNGQKTNAQTLADLSQGAQQISVSFPAQDILRLGVDGPYALTEGLLTLHADKVLVADYRKDVGTTDALESSSFSRDPLGFNGRNNVSASDTNADGKYDLLKVEAGVFAAGADFYQWSGTLVDANGVEIDFSAGSGSLPAGGGTVAFAFDGRKIGRNGVNGPYMLRSVLLFGAGQSVIVDELLKTPAYSYKEFEDSDNLRLGAVALTETDGDLDNSIEPGEDGSLAVRLSNVGTVGMTNVSATLTSSTPGVTVNAGQTNYPDLAAAGGGTGATPFAFSLAQNVPCGQKIDFTLTVRHAEDGGVPSVIHFSVQTGQGSQAAYSYGGPAVSIPDANSAGVGIPLTVSGFSGNIEDLNFRFGGNSCTSAHGATTVGLDHSWVGDLVITLTSPQGTTVTLLSRPGGGGDGNNFCNTTFDDEGGVSSIQSINALGAPYTGTFTPASPLAAFRGQNPNGTWTLRVSDRVGDDTGSVRAFSLVFTGATSCADSAAPKTTAARVNAPNAAGWNNTDAVVALVAADNKGGSGVRHITYSATGAQVIPETTVSGPSTSLTVAAEGVTTVSFRATDAAGNVEATKSVTVMVDKTAPTVVITSPSAANYMLNQAVAAGYACADGGSGPATCVGTAPVGGGVDTSTGGAHTFTVTAADVAGNAATASVVYNVANDQTYDIRLLYDAGKAHKSGSTIPVKIQVLSALSGQNVSSSGLVVHALGVTKESEYAPGPAEDAGNANPDDDFRFNNFEGAGGYIFNLKTTGLATGTYVLVFKVGSDSFTYGVRFQVK